MQNLVDHDARQDAVRAFDTIVARLRQKIPHAAEEIYLQKGLAVQTNDMPDWWRESNNILVAPIGFKAPIPSYVGIRPPRNSIVVISAYYNIPNQMILSGDGPIVFVGPHCNLPGGTIICGGNSMIVLAGNLFSIGSANLDARNEGLIYVGDDNLWSSNVKINTDDMHAIFDHASLKRINRYGSVIVIGTHVWLGLDVLINPGAVICDNVVIGSRSVITKAIPMGCVAVGTPARVVKRGVTWTREDIPPTISMTDFGLSPLDRSVDNVSARFFQGRRLRMKVMESFNRYFGGRN